MAKVLSDRATVSELSRHLVRRPHTMLAIVTRMERRGLVTIDKDLNHRNWGRVEITEKGDKAYLIITKPDSIYRILKNLKDKERMQFGRCLEKILAEAKVELGLTSDGRFSSD
jgi:DNA-binding MarR family transcriptional regulator